jgi:hypothetical protein
MKQLRWISVITLLVLVAGCAKEYSLENGNGATNGGDDVIGVDCRLAKMVYYDSATNIALGSLAATINTEDTVNDITFFDSLNNRILANSMPLYGNDTIYLNPDEYFITDPATGNVIKAHGSFTFPAIPFEVDYIYNSNGTLFQKHYDIPGAGISPAIIVEYTYAGGNLVGMTSTDYTTVTPELIMDGELTYYNNIAPRANLNFMPDETLTNDLNHFAMYTQFFNFGKKSTNAIKYMKVRTYDPGNVVRDSTVSNFVSYITSLDNYITSFYMLGDDQESLPAAAGRIVFKYHCKP